ncbi:MAG TPA: FHA domain-containing protein [Kofleriaceae bacterium]|nr:FHA domain-containing protein [Kofleriaceae bacterium]
MDAAAHYRHLRSLGRDEFLAAAAPAVLVRQRGDAAAPDTDVPVVTVEVDAAAAFDETSPQRTWPADGDALELYPLTKKPGASFPDRITIGRTPNNDVVIPDHSVSRLHAYARPADHGWRIADAGSKNGSWLDDTALEPRREVALPPGGVLTLGDVRLTFYRARDLFDLLGDDQ